jgi:RimJ/RimL family protein N-acetyltransferase
MCQPFLHGVHIYLRPLEAEDVPGRYQDWLNDYEVTRFLETGAFPTTVPALRAYVETVARSPENVMLGVIEKVTNTHVGNVKLGPIQALHRRADLGIMIGDRTRWGKGYGREAVALVVDYGFRRLNLNKITLGVYADHEAAVRLYQGLGFAIEGTLRQQLYRDGAYRDAYVMGILREDYLAGGPGR